MVKMTFPYGLIYGPHVSQRLGLSLGIDLTPNTCTFNCIYCERGRTLVSCRSYREFNSPVSNDAFLEALQKRIFALQTCDCLTFAGTGEPTLDSRLDTFITTAIKIAKQTPIKIITNSSQLMHPHVIRNLSKADEVIAKLNAVSDLVFTTLHRPFDTTLKPQSVIKGLHTLKRTIGTKLTIEILFIRSHKSLMTNTTTDELEKLTAVLRQLAPGQVQIHTIKRAPAESYVLPVKWPFLTAVGSLLKKTLTTTKVTTNI